MQLLFCDWLDCEVPLRGCCMVSVLQECLPDIRLQQDPKSAITWLVRGALTCRQIAKANADFKVFCKLNFRHDIRLMVIRLPGYAKVALKGCSYLWYKREEFGVDNIGLCCDEVDCRVPGPYFGARFPGTLQAELN